MTVIYKKHETMAALPVHWTGTTLLKHAADLTLRDNDEKTPLAHHGGICRQVDLMLKPSVLTKPRSTLEDRTPEELVRCFHLPATYDIKSRSIYQVTMAHRLTRLRGMMFMWHTLSRDSGGARR